MTFWIEHDGSRFDFPTLKTAADYFHGCLLDESIGTDIRLIDTDGRTVVAVVNWDGISETKQGIEP
jgi:hypothetical protein